MKLSGALKVLTPLVLAGVAGVAAARRKAEERRRELLPGMPDTPPIGPPPVLTAEPVEPVGQVPPSDPDPEPVDAIEVDDDEPEPQDAVVEPELEPEPEPQSEAEPATTELPGVEEAPEPEAPAPESAPRAAEPTVTDIVDDLLAPDLVAPPIQDADVVEGTADEVVRPPGDDELAQRVRAALAEAPGLPGEVEVLVRRGRAVLRGEVAHPDTINALEERAGSVAGIRGVDSLLRLPGTPPPAGGRRR